MIEAAASAAASSKRPAARSARQARRGAVIGGFGSRLRSRGTVTRLSSTRRVRGEKRIRANEAQMFNVVLYEPEIPSNTGNVGRLCVAVGATLHVVGRPAFHLDDKAVRRAGLDYWQDVRLFRHVDLAAFEATHPAERLFCFSAHAPESYARVRYQPGDALVFGSESRGLPPEVLAR